MQIPPGLPTIYFSCTGDGTILQVNNRLTEYLGYTESDLTGKNVQDILHSASRIFFQTHFYPLLQMQGSAEEIYLSLKTSDNRDIPFLLNARKEIEEGTAVFHYSGLTMLRRLKFEEEILRARKAAEDALQENSALAAARDALEKHSEQLENLLNNAAIRNEEFRLFSQVTTHELQEPMRKLQIYSDKIRLAKNGENTSEYLEKVEAAADRFRVVLQGIQQYMWATEVPVNWRKMNLSNELEQVILRVRTDNPDLHLSIGTVPINIPHIEANEDQMRFVLREIFDNAIRFRKPGNTVHIEMHGSVVQLNRFRKLPYKFRLTEFVRLEVRDEGVGMDEEFCEQALMLFKRLHENSGAGVNLSLCKRIVENHGGMIDIHSKRNEGTAVVLFLPIKQEKD